MSRDDPARWRAGLLAEHPGASALLAEAEQSARPESRSPTNAIIPMKERSADQRYDPLGRVLRSWRRRPARVPTGEERQRRA